MKPNLSDTLSVDAEKNAQRNKTEPSERHVKRHEVVMVKIIFHAKINVHLTLILERLNT